jgi:hypothetical protein
MRPSASIEQVRLVGLDWDGEEQCLYQFDGFCSDHALNGFGPVDWFGCCSNLSDRTSGRQTATVWLGTLRIVFDPPPPGPGTRRLPPQAV